MSGAVAERKTMEKIEPRQGFYIQVRSEDGRWIAWDGIEDADYENAKFRKRRLEKRMQGFEFRIVRATTTYEVMEEAK